jgi:N-hydroxyarylamine O-acetyltransferase
MEDHVFDTEAYLQRIKYTGGLTPSVETLEALHHAQFHAIPFENFDIQLGRSINLAPQALFHKLVNKKRGGYCFELNGLFLEALRAFGFNARALLGRVHITGKPSGRGHQIELITIQGKQWIADVGFGGDNPRSPIPLELNRPIVRGGQTFRLVKDEHFGTMYQSLKNDRWTDLYSFDLCHVCPADINYGNHFTATHPRSLFVSARVAALPIENGGITLLNKTLKKVVSGVEKVQQLEEGQPYLDALKEHFGIELDEPYEKLRPMHSKDTAFASFADI